MEAFNVRLKRLMGLKNLNNSSLGRQINKVPSTVKNWVDGIGKPELNTLEDMAEILGVTPAYLLYGVEDPPKKNLLEEPQAVYGIPKEDLIEFYKWKADMATKQVERLKSIEVDAK
ncbi:MAG: helix-turn-helix domain-containing protein [Leadbetterella sp.]|nr:helix-turn-helix domain-containing protein [Leadbetterella sp.]